MYFFFVCAFEAVHGKSLFNISMLKSISLFTSYLFYSWDQSYSKGGRSSTVSPNLPIEFPGEYDYKFYELI